MIRFELRRGFFQLQEHQRARTAHRRPPIAEVSKRPHPLSDLLSVGNRTDVLCYYAHLAAARSRPPSCGGARDRAAAPNLANDGKAARGRPGRSSKRIPRAIISPDLTGPEARVTKGRGGHTGSRRSWSQGKSLAKDDGPGAQGDGSELAGIGLRGSRRARPQVRALPSPSKLQRPTSGRANILVTRDDSPQADWRTAPRRPVRVRVWPSVSLTVLFFKGETAPVPRGSTTRETGLLAGVHPS